MKRLFETLWRLTAAAFTVYFAVCVHAQELWKYTDKNGKVTYSDKAPVDGEKAERVSADTTGTVIPAAKNMVGGASQSSASIRARASEREGVREAYRKSVETAREELEQARKALQSGQEPTQDERQIVFGRGKDGQASGANTVIRKPEYYERIAALEAAVKTAEEKLTNAEREQRKNSPR